MRHRYGLVAKASTSARDSGTRNLFSGRPAHIFFARVDWRRGQLLRD
ncbi:MAG: hypothetical protein AB7F41_09330 [Methylocystis sp.]